MAPRAIMEDEINTAHLSSKPQHKLQIIWPNVILLLLLHLGFVYGCCTWIVRELVYGISAGLGITAGSHRLWCHRSYKARLPLRILLATLFCIAAETDLYVWCRDHRVHHKYSETDADPHNIKRGFFFAHCGWLMCRKHPDVAAKGKTVYLDDLMADPVVRFQRRFHMPLCLLFRFCIPTTVLTHFFREPLCDAFLYNVVFYVIFLHATWLVNSAAHQYGTRPYDRHIAAADNPLVALAAHGEGWHNYHHTFPWDYSTGEMGNRLNLTKVFVDLMASLGLAYDLRKVSEVEILNRKVKTGDGSRA